MHCHPQLKKLTSVAGIHRNIKNYDIMKSIDDFIQKLKSHYCRASSNKKYLPAEMGNLSRLYQVYKYYCAQNKIEIVKNSLFRKIFKKKYNIGFHYPV